MVSSAAWAPTAEPYQVSVPAAVGKEARARPLHPFPSSTLLTVH